MIEKFKQKTIDLTEKFNTSKYWNLLTVLFATIYTIFMSRQTISMHKQFMQLADFAAYDQVVWSLSQHFSYESSICGSIMNLWKTINATSPDGIPAVAESYSVLGIHFIPSVFFTNALPNMLFNSPYTTYVVHTLAFATTAVLLFYILAKQAVSLPVAFVLAISFLIHPANMGANVNAFHPVIMALPFLLCLYWAIIAGRMKTYWVLFFFTGFIQENLWLTLTAFSLVFAFRKKWTYAGLNLIVGIGLLVVTTQIFIPFFNHDHTCPYCGIYGSPLGTTMGEIVKNGILKPLETWALLVRPEILKWLNQLFHPVIYLTIFNPVSLILALVGVAPSVLSTNGAMHLMWGQYNALAMPFIYLGAGLGFSFLQRKLKFFRWHWLWAFIILWISIGDSKSWSYSGPTSIQDVFSLTPRVYADPALVSSYQKTLALIPENATTSATEYFLNSLSRRTHAYFFPVGYLEAEYVVIEKQTLTVPKEKLAPRIEELIQSNKYSLIVDDNFIQLWRKKSIAN